MYWRLCRQYITKKKHQEGLPPFQREISPMMYLHPPFYMYEGVPVVPDYSDPRQFYYFPNRPHLAVDEHNRPAIRFLVYKENLDEITPDQEQATGFLFFDTSLAWP